MSRQDQWGPTMVMSRCVSVCPVPAVLQQAVVVQWWGKDAQCGEVPRTAC